MSDVYMNQLRGSNSRYPKSVPEVDHVADARADTPIKRGTMHAPAGGVTKFPK